MKQGIGDYIKHSSAQASHPNKCQKSFMIDFYWLHLLETHLRLLFTMETAHTKLGCRQLLKTLQMPDHSPMQGKELCSYV